MSFLSIQNPSTLNILFSIVGFFLCLISYIVRLSVHVYEFKKNVEFPKKLFPLLIAVIFLGYIGWGFWSGTDPVKMNIPFSVTIPVGGVLTLVGFGLFLYSEFKKHRESKKTELVTSGIYSKIRHPIYIGLILLHIGYPFIGKSFVALCSTVIWAGFILVWKNYEEKNLERKFGEQYREYKKQTWF